MTNPNDNKVVLKWEIVGKKAYRSMRGEKEGSGLIPDIEVKFFEGVKKFERNDQNDIVSAKFDPQFEKTLELLKMSPEEFRKESDKYYTGKRECPEFFL